MSINIHNITHKQGTVFIEEVTVLNEDETPRDITGATFKGQVRDKYGASAILFSFVFNITDAANGVFTYSLPATFFTTTMIDKRTMVYDVEMTLAGSAEDMFGGTFTVLPGVSK